MAGGLGYRLCFSFSSVSYPAYPSGISHSGINFFLSLALLYKCLGVSLFSAFFFLHQPSLFFPFSVLVTCVAFSTAHVQGCWQTGFTLLIGCFAGRRARAISKLDSPRRKEGSEGKERGGKEGAVEGGRCMSTAAAMLLVSQSYRIYHPSAIIYSHSSYPARPRHISVGNPIWKSTLLG